MNEKISSLSNNLVQHSRKGAILSKEEEFALINSWRKNKDNKALQKILNAYLRNCF